jgi:hypothetical protein
VGKGGDGNTAPAHPDILLTFNRKGRYKSLNTSAIIAAFSKKRPNAAHFAAKIRIMETQK